MVSNEFIKKLHKKLARLATRGKMPFLSRECAIVKVDGREHTLQYADSIQVNAHQEQILTVLDHNDLLTIEITHTTSTPIVGGVQRGVTRS